MIRTFAYIALFAALSRPICAQTTPAPTPAGVPAVFEAADVHVSPHHANPFSDGGVLRGDRYTLRQSTMLDLIAAAYALDTGNVQGGPSWLETDRFDVAAKAPAGTPPATVKLMLQALLIDRFKLVTHTGSKPMPAYQLIAAEKGKSKMTQSDGTGDGTCTFQPPKNAAPGTVSYVQFACRNMTMESFAQFLQRIGGLGYLEMPVADSTGLSGAWDFDLKWTPRGQLQKAGSDGISVFDALDKQLGLKLEQQTAPRSVLIVDSVNQTPTPNLPGIEKSLPTPPPAQFDVAVIKASKPDITQMNGNIGRNQVNLQGATLKFLIGFAWDLNLNDNEVLVGAPKWLDSDHFDILAKFSGQVASGGSPNAPPIDIEDLRQMVRDLLTDRFQMKTHMEDRPVTAYNLIAANPKLHPADPTSRTRCKEGPGPDGKDPRIASPVLNRLLSCQNMTTAQIGEELQRIAPGYIYSPVLDMTGLKGSWDFTLSFSSVDLTRASAAGSGSAGASGSPSDPNGALSLFDAVNKELGLKLEKVRRPVPVLVIDHVEEKPTEN